MSFQVMVGNGGKLTHTSVCHHVPITLANTLLSIDFFVLPMSGADIVLGIQCIKTLGPKLTN